MTAKQSPAKSNLSEYYKPIRLNPVGHDISRQEQLTAHERKRRNLVEHKLKLPGLMWRDCRVLEFGPASGENAAVLARHGAQMTFVEPLDYLIAELKDKFASLGISDRVEAIHQDVLETFKTSDRFDVVWAEGFVHFMEDSALGVRNLSSFVRPGGFLVLGNLVEPVGTFIEFVKKAYLALASSALDRRDPEQHLALASVLYGGQFASINHSRAFEKWVKDSLLNPLYRPRHFFDLPRILQVLPAEFVPYSTWPNYIDHDDLVWHKNVKDAAALRAEALRGYYARAPHFLHSSPQGPGELPLFAPEDGGKVVAALHACYAKMEKSLLAQDAKPAAHLAGLAGLRRTLAGLPQARPALEVVDETIALFRAGGKARDEAAFSHAWKSKDLLSRIWGSPGHYFVFQRSSPV
ncbi:MAG: class I SAM-dependent methyltransferase [Elusimicrobia bacterium]|nr:class I SAM-dependent methyltransferase [Elusimicrobiota bacterium]